MPDPAPPEAATPPPRWHEADRLLASIRYADTVTPDEVDWMLAHIGWLRSEVERLEAAARASSAAERERIALLLHCAESWDDIHAVEKSLAGKGSPS
jgi:hypothetical protein